VRCVLADGLYLPGQVARRSGDSSDVASTASFQAFQTLNLRRHKVRLFLRRAARDETARIPRVCVCLVQRNRSSPSCRPSVEFEGRKTIGGRQWRAPGLKVLAAARVTVISGPGNYPRARRKCARRFVTESPHHCPPGGIRERNQGRTRHDSLLVRLKPKPAEHLSLLVGLPLSAARRLTTE